MNEDNIYEKGCMIFFKTRFWGATKALSESQLGDLPSEIVNASRDLLIETNKLEAVRGILGEARTFIKSNTMPFPIPGVDFISKNRISIVDSGLKIRKEWAVEAVEDLTSVLEVAKRRYKEKFPELYSESNYPTALQLKDNLIFEWNFRIISPPGKDLAILSPEVYDAEVSSFKRQIKDFEESLISIVAAEFYNRIDKLRDQCIGTGDISQATIKSTKRVIEKFNNIYDGFISHDQLNGMIKDVSIYLDGTEASMIKADDDFRAMVGTKMKEVTDLIKNSKDERLTRRIDC